MTSTRYFIQNATFFNSFLCSWCVWMPYTFSYFEKYRSAYFRIILTHISGRGIVNQNTSVVCNLTSVYCTTKNCSPRWWWQVGITVPAKWEGGGVICKLKFDLVSIWTHFYVRTYYLFSLSVIFTDIGGHNCRDHWKYCDRPHRVKLCNCLLSLTYSYNCRRRFTMSNTSKLLATVTNGNIE
jgi:hypothetical protein